MTMQEKAKDLVTVNGVPAALGLRELAQNVSDFEFYSRKLQEDRRSAREERFLGHDDERRAFLRLARQARDGADCAYRGMVAKAAVVLGGNHLTKIVKSSNKDRPHKADQAKRRKAKRTK